MDDKQLPEVLRRIKDGKLTRASAAKLLDVSERHVNRLMRMHAIARPRGKALEARAAARAQRGLRRLAAYSVAVGERTLAAGAELAGCSARTMYRWVQKARKGVQKHQKSSKKMLKNNNLRRNRAK